MFRLLSKESTIFSIPVYIGFLLLVVVSFNILYFNALDTIVAIIALLGVAVGYFCFNTIALNYQSHLPLFLYTFFVFGFYSEQMDIGIAVSLLTNSFIMLILTSTNEDLKKKSYVLIGALLSINYLFLPYSWPLAIFVLFHIIATSEKIGLNLFRLFFGGILVFFAYFCVLFGNQYTEWNPEYWAIPNLDWRTNYWDLAPLIPVMLLLLYSVFDHFQHYNLKSPISKYKYTFLLIFITSQVITLLLYMGTTYDYFLLLALPLSIILSRMLKFLPKYWMKEVFLWVIIFSVIIFKINQNITSLHFLN